MNGLRLGKKHNASKVTLPKKLREAFPGIKWVRDSLGNVRIDINGDDRGNAVANSHTGCAMALGCKRNLGVDGAFIALTTSYLVKDDTVIRFATPGSVAREIVTFDRHNDFSTGAYHLAKVNPSRLLGATPREGQGRRDGLGGRKRVRFIHSTTRVRSV